MNNLACSIGDKSEFLSINWGLIVSKLEMAYTEPAVPRAFNFPTGVIGNKCKVFIPEFLISSSLSIAFIKLPRSSP